MKIILKKYRRSLFGLVGVILLMGLWEAASRLGLIDAELFPPLTQIFVRVGELLSNGEFLRTSVWPSVFRLGLAALAVIPLGLLLGIAAGRSADLYAFGAPVFNFTYPLPKVAIFPFILVLFGLGNSGKIILIAIGMFYPFFLNVMEGTRRLFQSPYADLIRIYRIRGVNLYFHFLCKGLLADLRTGLKASFGYGFTLVIVSEYTASRDGIGHFIWRSWDSYSILNMYAGVAIICALGWLVQTLLDEI